MHDSGMDAVWSLAARQHGVVARRQLLEAGLTSSAVHRRLARGIFKPIAGAGVYLLGPVERPRSREMAATLAAGPGSVVSHRSAASLWGLLHPDSRPASPPLPVEISVQLPARGPRREGVLVHRVRSLPDDERRECEGIPITSPARTLLDLAAILGQRELETAVARADREGLADASDVERLLARHPGATGSALLREVMGREEGAALTRSEAEMRFLQLVRRARLPAPRVNRKFGPFELDFYWPAAKLAVEIDGFEYHSSRASFVGDRRRDAWLVSRGIRVLRLAWAQVTREEVATAVQLGRALQLQE